VFVRGGLPDELAMAEGSLAAAGSIEIYESSRLVATTFRHVEGTSTTLPDAAEVVAALAWGVWRCIVTATAGICRPRSYIVLFVG
jgi:hypothetical protein